MPFIFVLFFFFFYYIITINSSTLTPNFKSAALKAPTPAIISLISPRYSSHPLLRAIYLRANTSAPLHRLKEKAARVSSHGRKNLHTLVGTNYRTKKRKKKKKWATRVPLGYRACVAFLPLYTCAQRGLNLLPPRRIYNAKYATSEKARPTAAVLYFSLVKLSPANDRWRFERV